MKLRNPITVSLFLTLALISAASVGYVRPVHAQQTRLSVFSEDYFATDIADPTFTTGSKITLDILAEDLPPIVDPTHGGINAFDITVTYDPTVLKATQASASPPVCFSDIYSCLFDGGFTVTKEVDNPPGTTRLAIVLLGTAVTGTGILFSIEFQVVARGFTVIEIQDGTLTRDALVKFVDTTGDGLWENGEFVVYDTNNNNQYDQDERIIVGSSVSIGEALAVDSKLVFWDVNHDGVWNPGETVVYDVNGDGKYQSQTDTNVNHLTEVPVSTLASPAGTAIDNIPYSRFNGTFENRLPYVLSVNPNYGRTVGAGSVSANVNVSEVWTRVTFPERVNLTLTGLPASSTAILGPDNGNFLSANSFVSQMTLIATAATPLGNYTIQVNATSRYQSPVTANILMIKILFNFTLIVDLSDIAILNITPSTVEVTHGGTVTLSSSVQNKGFAAQKFTVTFKANSTIVASPEVAVPGLTTQTVTATWNTTTFSPGKYEITGDLPTLPGETVTSDNTFSDGTVNVQPIQDIAVTTVNGSPTTVNPGSTVTVTVTVQNNGEAAESFTVDLFANTNKVDTESVVSLGPGASTTLTMTWDTTGFSPGPYQLRANATQLARETNTADNSKNGNSIRLNAPPVAMFTHTPSAPVPGQTVSFDATQSSDPDTGDFVAIYAWIFGDGGTASSAVGTADHVYQSAGIYTVTLTITDYYGGTAITTQQIVVNSPPTADFTFNPSAATAGQAVSFDASLSIDNDGSIASYSWDFGDGATGTGQRPMHTYQSAGTYTVKMTVTDNNGATRTKTILVAVGEGTSLVSVLTSPLGLGLIVAVVVIAVGALLYMRSRKPAAQPPEQPPAKSKPKK